MREEIFRKENDLKKNVTLLLWKKNVHFAGSGLNLLSTPQPDFKHTSKEFGTFTYSNALLLHKLLVTGKGQEVVSRKGELNREILSRTCNYKIGSSGKIVSKVRIQVQGSG